MLYVYSIVYTKHKLPRSGLYQQYLRDWTLEYSSIIIIVTLYNIKKEHFHIFLLNDVIPAAIINVFNTVGAFKVELHAY